MDERDHEVKESQFKEKQILMMKNRNSENDKENVKEK